MSFLQTYLLRMAVFLVLVAIAAAFIAPGLQDAFLANVWLNGLILLILLVGIVYSFVQVLRLRGEIYWLETLRRESRGGLVFQGDLPQERPPRLLGPMVLMIADRPDGRRAGEGCVRTCRSGWSATQAQTQNPTTP